MKKPSGLKKAAAAKKPAAKAEEPAAVVQTAGDGEVQIAVDGGAEGDETAELQQMLAMALAQTAADGDDGGDGGGSDDAGAQLLRGVVHEADRILRGRAAAGQLLLPLKPGFHLAYGEALLRLGILRAHAAAGGEDDAGAFFDAAAERLDAGLAAAAASGGITASAADPRWKLHDALARAGVEKANWLLATAAAADANAAADAAVAAAFKHAAQALALLAALVPPDPDEAVALVALFVRHALLRPDADPAKKKWTNVARVELHKIVKADPAHVPAWILLAQTYLAAANDLLDAGEDGAQDVDMAIVAKLIDETLKYATRAQSELQKKEADRNVELELLLGEAYVNKANLLDENENEDEANAYYKKAVDCFKFVESVDSSMLPEAFDSFLRDWESEMEQ